MAMYLRVMLVDFKSPVKEKLFLIFLSVLFNDTLNYRTLVTDE